MSIVESIGARLPPDGQSTVFRPSPPRVRDVNEVDVEKEPVATE